MIAVNTKRTGNPKRDNRGYAEPMTSEQLDRLLSEDWLREMVADIRAGKEELKERLPFVCPHYSRFKNNHRAQKDIIPEAFTFMTCVDVDDKDLVAKAIENTKALMEDEMSEWHDMVLRMAKSARDKLHIWVRLPKGKTIQETQEEFCKEIGVPYDDSCTTPERFIFITGIDQEIYRSPDWMKPLPAEEIEERREAYINRGLDVDGRNGKQFTVQDAALVQEVQGVQDAALVQRVQDAALVQGVKPTPPESSPRTRYIMEACMKEAEVTEDMLVNEGARHNSVKSILSVGATQLLTREEFMAELSLKMPENWMDKNIQQLVTDFYNKYHEPEQKMNQFQRRVFARSLKNGNGNFNGNGNGNGDRNCPPAMPKKLPKLIKLLTKNTPEQYKAAVAHAVFPPLATHLCKVSFRYTDNKEHEATLMNCVMAGTGTGKGCIDDPIEHIMADIKRRDKENEKREKEWKKECQRKGDNKDKRDRPEGLVIQMIDPDMTKPALVTRMDESEGHFVYVKLNELDLFEQLKGQTGKQHFQLMCLAFDPGAEYGQTRIGTQSVTARPRCRFNWNACTTIQKGRKFFSRVLTDGPISRINFCTIPEEEIGGEQPIYGVYDAAFDEELKPYIDRLCAARGLTDCPQAFKLAKRLQQEVAEFAQLSQDKVYWNLSHRACVIAWLKACVLYVANGCRWESAIEDFVRWSLKYDLWCKMQFFGEAIAKAESGDDARIGTRGPRNLLELLPDTFTLDDAKRIRRQQGMDIDCYRTEKMIRTWINRKYVIQNTEYSFQKSRK